MEAIAGRLGVVGLLIQALVRIAKFLLAFLAIDLGLGAPWLSWAVGSPFRPGSCWRGSPLAMSPWFPPFGAFRRLLAAAAGIGLFALTRLGLLLAARRRAAAVLLFLLLLLRLGLRTLPAGRVAALGLRLGAGLFSAGQALGLRVARFGRLALLGLCAFMANWLLFSEPWLPAGFFSALDGLAPDGPFSPG